METTTTRRLYKSRRNRMIDGICGGVAEYFGIDPTLVRIVWVLLTLLGGSGFFLYIAAMIIMPVNPQQIEVQPAGGVPGHQEPDRRRFWGMLLVLIGAFALIINLGWFSDIHWWSISGSVVLPILLILLGIILIYTYTRRGADPEVVYSMSAEGTPAPISQPPRELRRSVRDRKIFGVCGGIAQYFNVDSTIVRVLFILLILASFGWGLLLYIILAIVMPEEKPSMTSA